MPPLLERPLPLYLVIAAQILRPLATEFLRSVPQRCTSYLRRDLR